MERPYIATLSNSVGAQTKKVNRQSDHYVNIKFSEHNYVFPNTLLI